MSDLKPHAQPSMEEILASINRLIAEDRKSGEPAPRPVPVPVPTPVRDEVFDLTEAIAPDGSLRHLAPAAAAQPPDPAERLVSTASSGIAAAAFARLAALPREPHRAAEAPAGGERFLEDLVRDALRPLLQAWLDEHLPALVERLVREEIARIAGAAGTLGR
jgi:uncharacterized protein